MKKHLLTLCLFGEIIAETVSEANINDGQLSVVLPLENKQIESDSKDKKKSLPILIAYEESAPKIKDQQNLLQGQTNEESLTVLKAYEELLPIIKIYEEYFTALEQTQKKIQDDSYTSLKIENENLKKEAKKAEQQLNKMFKMKKNFNNDLDIENILNTLCANFKKAYLNYLNKIEQLMISDQDKKKSIKESNILYNNTIALIKKNHPTEKKIQKLKNKKKAKNREINKKIKQLRLQQNEKIKKIDKKLLKSKGSKVNYKSTINAISKNKK